MKSLALVGTAGEHYVCAELCRRNVVAVITPKNNPLFDVVASDLEGRHSVCIQVKTMSTGNQQGWKLGIGITKEHENPHLFVVLVDLRDDGVRFFVYPHDVLARRVSSAYEAYRAFPKRDGTPRKDIGFRWFDYAHMTAEDYARRDNWGLLGLPDLLK